MWLALAKSIRDDIMWATCKPQLEDMLVVSGSQVVLSLYSERMYVMELRCRHKIHYAGCSMCISESEDMWSRAAAADPLAAKM